MHSNISLLQFLLLVMTATKIKFFRKPLRWMMSPSRSSGSVDDSVRNLRSLNMKRRQPLKDSSGSRCLLLKKMWQNDNLFCVNSFYNIRNCIFVNISDFCCLNVKICFLFEIRYYFLIVAFIIFLARSSYRYSGWDPNTMRKGVFE